MQAINPVCRSLCVGYSRQLVIVRLEKRLTHSTGSLCSQCGVGDGMQVATEVTAADRVSDACIRELHLQGIHAPH